VRDGTVSLRRSAGKLSNLDKVITSDLIDGDYGIGHTRWATHGRPTEENAHPHRDCTGRTIVVHNGIIENYLDLKTRLQQEGHAFVTETDTESIAHLIEREMNGDGLDGEADLAAVERVTVLACGTSWHAGLVGKFLIETLAQVPVEVDYGSEYRYRSPIVPPRTLAVVITQSGETADTLAALREARRQGAHSLAICNVVGSMATREADGTVYTHAGPEIGVASTKAFKSQLVALYLIALRLGQLRGSLSQQASKPHVSSSRLVEARRLATGAARASPWCRRPAGRRRRWCHRG
jgi:glucosamine 6-phosphate synthetase-like amidotransferase/phosphosugar isomerase protein